MVGGQNYALENTPLHDNKVGGQNYIPENTPLHDNKLEAYSNNSAFHGTLLITFRNSISTAGT
jgi:hypothetical protein